MTGNVAGSSTVGVGTDATVPVIEARRLSAAVELPDRRRLITVNDASLTLLPYRSYAITGKSGSGKTSLVSILGLLNRDYTGTLRFRGTDTRSFTDRQCARLRGRHIGFVFQNYSLIPQLSVLDNITLPLAYADAAFRQSRRRAVNALVKEIGLADRLRERPHALSGGEQQRVAIARALCAGPELLICDEPTGALDTATGMAIMDKLFDLARSHGTTLLLVTHDLDLAARCDKRFDMERGTIR